MFNNKHSIAGGESPQNWLNPDVLVRGARQARSEKTHGRSGQRLGQHHRSVRPPRGEPHRRHGEGHGVPRHPAGG